MRSSLARAVALAAALHLAPAWSAPQPYPAPFEIRDSKAEDNAEAYKTRLAMPVLAIGGEKSFGATEAVVMRNAATNVTETVIPAAGHWLMEEAPEATIQAVLAFVQAK